MTSTPRAQLPPRLLPVLYFGAAHVALALAFGAVALDPRGVSGFFYHSRMLGIVHLVTLGWITASILGPLYMVGPIALRMWIPATWLDYTAFVLVLIGIVGMVAHFWIQDYAGMSSGSVVTDSILGSRVLSYLDQLDQPLVEGKSSELAPTKELPWIDGLDASGVMGVREEAHSALPSLRALMRSAVFSDRKDRASALDNLRAQVIEVETELRALRIIKRRTNMIAAAGLLFGVAGYGTRQPATILAGLAGFLSALAAAHGSSTTTELREHALIHKPAYLLLKAKEVRESLGHGPVT